MPFTAWNPSSRRYASKELFVVNAKICAAKQGMLLILSVNIWHTSLLSMQVLKFATMKKRGTGTTDVKADCNWVHPFNLHTCQTVRPWQKSKPLRMPRPNEQILTTQMSASASL